VHAITGWKSGTTEIGLLMAQQVGFPALPFHRLLMEISPIESAVVELVSVIGFEIVVRVCQGVWFSVRGF
jgi:hypothetical protein